MRNSLRVLAAVLLVVTAGCVSAPMARTPTNSETAPMTAEPPARDEIQLKEHGTINTTYLNRTAATVYRTYAAGAEQPCASTGNNTTAAVRCSASLTPVDRAREVMHTGTENQSEQDLKAAIAYAVSVYTIVNKSVQWEELGPNSRLNERLTPAARHEFDVAIGFLVLAYHEHRMNSTAAEQNGTANTDEAEEQA